MFRVHRAGKSCSIPMAILYGFCAATCAAQPVPPANSPATMPSQQEMFDELRSLRQEVRDLRAQVDNSTHRPEAAYTYTRADNDQTRQAVQSDAAGRDIGPGDTMGLFAGYSMNEGFQIRSADGNFLLHPWAFVQIRDATNYRAHATGSSSDTENGFELPRAKFILDGNVFSKDFTYQIIWATSDTTGNLGLQDAWLRYHFAGTPFAVEVGQIRDPVDHEQFLYATKSLTADRSIVNNVLLNGDDIVKGIELSYGYDTDYDLGAKLAFTSGQRNLNTTFQDYPTNAANWGLAGRVEWKLMGKWADYAQFTALNDRQPLWVFGLGADYTEAGSTSALTHVLDVQYDLPSGLALYAAYLGRYTRDDAGSPSTNGTPASGTTLTGADTYDSTFRLMGAYLFQQRFEPFVRYEYLQFDPREFAPHTNATVHDATIGFNYYFYGHRAKITSDASYLPNGSPVSNTLGDLLTTHRGSEWILQVQFQLIM